MYGIRRSRTRSRYKEFDGLVFEIVMIQWTRLGTMKGSHRDNVLPLQTKTGDKRC